MISQALKTLEKDILQNIDIIEPIKRGIADVIYADDETVLINLPLAQCVLLYCENVEKGITILKEHHFESITAFRAQQREVLNFAKKKFNFTNEIVCYQISNLSREYADVPNILEIKALDISVKDAIYSHYKVYTLDELDILLENKQIFGGFKDEKLIGFIGIHMEGSCGMLEIFPENRRKGYGTILEAYINNYVINKGWTPFGQVLEDNFKSLNLQQKLGMQLSKEKIYWTF